MQSFQEQDYTKRFDLSLWRKLIKVAKPYHKNLIAVVLFMAVSAIIDVIMPNMNAYAIDVFIANHSTAGLVGFVVAYALLTAVQVATIFGFLRQCGIVETGTCYLIRKLGFQKLQELPFSYYDRMPVGYLMSRLTNDTQRLADTIGWSLVDLCWGAVYLVACAVRMLTINWRPLLHAVSADQQSEYDRHIHHLLPYEQLYRRCDTPDKEYLPVPSTWHCLQQRFCRLPSR